MIDVREMFQADAAIRSHWSISFFMGWDGILILNNFEVVLHVYVAKYEYVINVIISKVYFI